MHYDLPRWSKGTKITAEQLNQLADAIERIADIGADGSSGLEVMETGSQRLLSVRRQRVGAYGKVVGGITAANGDNFGYGLVDVGYKDEDGKFVSYGDDPEDCYTISTTPSPDGVIIIMLWVDEDWAEVVERCPN